MLSHPIELAYPSRNRGLSKHKEKSGILWQCIRKFDIPRMAILSYPEREDGIHSIWLRLKRVSISRYQECTVVSKVMDTYFKAVCSEKLS
jgi:hypothetical protein